MKYLLVILLVALSPFTDLDRIATINKLKKEAREAYTNGNYQKALDNYKYLVDSMEVADDNITLNMANAYYKLNDTTQAINNYQELVDSKSNLVRSVAQQQLGVIANKSKKHEEALQHFKEALKADPTNEEARYNYELLKKILKEKEEQQQDQQNKQDKKDQQQKDKEQQQKDKQQQQDQQKQDQQKQDQENKDQQQQDQEQEGEGKEDEKEQKDGEKKDEKGEEKKKEPQEPQDGEESDEENKNEQDQMSSLSDKLDEMKISEEKAKMILEALKNKEIQYYQENKRKPTKRKDPNKPDW